MRKLFLALALLAPSVTLAQTAPPITVQMENGTFRQTTPSPTYCLQGGVWVGCPVASAGGSSTPTGAAGSPNTSVVTVQGISGGTPQPVSGTVSLGTGLNSIGSITNIAGTVSLPTGAATAAKQPTLGTAGSASADVLSVQGVAGGVAQNIAAASLPLPSGASTESTLATMSGKLPASLGIKTSALSMSVAPSSDGNWTVTQVSSATATVGAPPVATTAVASSLVLKASAGNVYSVNITTGATAGYLMVFNATTAPADGTVTPVKCLPVAANTGLDLNWRATPVYLSTGAVAVFSSTGCFTKTASATAFISGDVR